MDENIPDEMKIRKIVIESLFTHLLSRIDRIRESKIDFAHYTTSTTAFDIIKNRCIWLRNSRLLNDTSEMQAGLQTVRLNFAETSEAGGKFWQAMRSIDGYFKDKIDIAFQRKANEIFHQTYIGCLSEYPSSGADVGKLSMWRAYGYPHGVALIFDREGILSENITLDVMSYPVSYPKFGIHMLELEAGIVDLARNAESLSGFNTDLVANVIADIMVHLAICIKNSNFHEEAEWRIVYRKGVFSNEVSRFETQVIAGVPQLIRSVPLGDARPLALKQLLKKVVIGPTEFPEIAKEAFIKLLIDEGFSNPESKVTISNIPYRG